MDCVIFIRDVLLLLLYTLTSLISLIANGLVFQLSFQRRTKFNSLPFRRTSIHFLNLALADALSGLTIPIQFLFCSKHFLETYKFSSYSCILSKSIQVLGYNTSTITICIIAYDRYRLIQNPFKGNSRGRTFRMILFPWIISVLFSASFLVSTKVHTYFNSYEKLISCQILFPFTMKSFSSDCIRKIRVFSLIFFFHIIPFIIMTSLCSLTIRQLARRSIIGVQQFPAFRQSRIRSTRLLMIVVLIFIFSHLPINLLHLRDFFFSPMYSTRPHQCNDSTVYLLFYWLAISSCCHNPIIYSWFNRKYRSLFFCWCRSIIYCRRSE